MLKRLKCWLDQRRTIRRQAETIQSLTETLMAQHEVVRHRNILFLRKEGGWVMYQEVGFTPESKLRDANKPHLH